MPCDLIFIRFCVCVVYGRCRWHFRLEFGACVCVRALCVCGGPYNHWCSSRCFRIPQQAPNGIIINICTQCTRLRCLHHILFVTFGYRNATLINVWCTHSRYTRSVVALTIQTRCTTSTVYRHYISLSTPAVSRAVAPHKFQCDSDPKSCPFNIFISHATQPQHTHTRHAKWEIERRFLFFINFGRANDDSDLTHRVLFYPK